MRHEAEENEDDDDAPESMTISRLSAIAEPEVDDVVKTKTKKRGGRKVAETSAVETGDSTPSASSSLPAAILVAAAEEATRIEERKQLELAAKHEADQLSREQEQRHKRFQDIEEQNIRRKRKRTDNIVIEVVQHGAQDLKPCKDAAKFSGRMMGGTQVSLITITSHNTSPSL